MPRTASSPRGVRVAQVARALALLRVPRSTRDLGDALKVSEATAKRIVHGIREAGYKIESVREGREVRHRITREP